MPTSTWTNLDPLRRERVLDAAMAEFGRQGYSASSLNTIAREAGVAKGSLFQYFAGKLDFFSFVAEQTSGRILDEMRPWLDGPAPGRHFADYLTDAACAWVDYFAEHPLERGVTAATNLEIDPEVRAAVREPVHRTYAAGIRPLLEAARDRGELPPGTDVEPVLALLILLLPHLALAPFVPGLDPVLGLYGTPPEHLRAQIAALVTTVLGATAAVRVATA